MRPAESLPPAAPSDRLFRVSQSAIRLDLFLKEVAKTSRKQVKRWLDEGRVSVNGRKVIIASWELKKSEEVRVEGGVEAGLQSEAAKNYFLKVIYEDETVLVVEKDAGILSEATPASLKPALPEIVYQYLKRAHPQITHPYLLKLHRLDRETSGLMVYGKSKAAESLLKDFKEHRIQRRYLALVEGKVMKEQGKIEIPLVKNSHAKGKKMTPGSVEAGAKEARTEYYLLQRYPHHSLLRVELKTGRTHQVRAHLAAIGHPIVGDSVYGKNTTPSSAIALHAAELGFFHPTLHKKMIFKSKPPKKFVEWTEKKM